MIKIDLSLPIAITLIAIPTIKALKSLDGYWGVLWETFLMVLLVTMFVLGCFLLSYIIKGRI